MWWTYAENFKLISSLVLDLSLFNWKTLAIVGLRLAENGKRRPFSAKRRPTIAKIFQLISNKSDTNEDIGLKFSAYVHHMSGLNWQKNISLCSNSGSVAPSSKQKLWPPLATIFVETRMNVNSFQDREYVTPCLVMTKLGQVLAKQSKNWPSSDPIFAKYWQNIGQVFWPSSSY